MFSFIAKDGHNPDCIQNDSESNTSCHSGGASKRPCDNCPHKNTGPSRKFTRTYQHSCCGIGLSESSPCSATTGRAIVSGPNTYQVHDRCLKLFYNYSPSDPPTGKPHRRPSGAALQRPNAQAAIAMSCALATGCCICARSSACAISARMSSRSSSPIDSRTNPSLMPQAARSSGV